MIYPYCDQCFFSLKLRHNNSSSATTSTLTSLEYTVSGEDMNEINVVCETGQSDAYTSPTPLKLREMVVRRYIQNSYSTILELRQIQL